MLIESEVHGLFWPGDDSVLEDVGLKLEGAGRQKLCLKLLGKVVELVHVVAIISVLVKLADVYDKYRFGLFDEIHLYLLSYVLN